MRKPNKYSVSVLIRDARRIIVQELEKGNVDLDSIYNLQKACKDLFNAIKGIEEGLVSGEDTEIYTAFESLVLSEVAYENHLIAKRLKGLDSVHPLVRVALDLNLYAHSVFTERVLSELSASR